MIFLKNFGNHIGTAATSTYHEMFQRDVLSIFLWGRIEFKKNRIITTYETNPNVMDTQIRTQEKVSINKFINKQTNE